jgi:hypothetical protein
MTSRRELTFGPTKVDYQQGGVCAAEWRVEGMPTLTVDMAKRKTLKIVGSEWFRITQAYTAREFGFFPSPEHFQVRRAKLTNSKSASCRWHSDYHRGLWASIVYNTGGGWDVSLRTVFHELSHYLNGPSQGHNEIYTATMVAMMEREGYKAEAELLTEYYRAANVRVDSSWLDTMRVWMVD